MLWAFSICLFIATLLLVILIIILQICRHYLVKFCPHDLFTNTKSDLGLCEKVSVAPSGYNVWRFSWCLVIFSLLTLTEIARGQIINQIGGYKCCDFCSQLLTVLLQHCHNDVIHLSLAGTYTTIYLTSQFVMFN